MIITIFVFAWFVGVEGQGNVLGQKNGDYSSVYALQYGTSVPVLVLNASEANVTGSWVDFESQILFCSTRTAGGSGNILRVSYSSSSARAIFWFVTFESCFGFCFVLSSVQKKVWRFLCWCDLGSYWGASIGFSKHLLGVGTDGTVLATVQLGASTVRRKGKMFCVLDFVFYCFYD
jgi:hypothetical protein